MQRVYSSFASAVTVAQATNGNTCCHNIAYQPASVVTRQAIFDVLIGASATPADNATQWALMRMTVTGITGGSAITPSPADSNDAATTTLAYSKPTGTVTLGVFLLYLSMNQRVTFRWCAVPGSELIIPATATAGISAVSYLEPNPVVKETTLFWRE
jgi:hypothetical protein